MRRLKLFFATSLDGYIAARDGDTSWRFRDGDYGYKAFLASIDTVFLGRRTYEIALSSAQWPYPGRKVVVFTRSNTLRVISPNTVATSQAPTDIIEDLRARDGKDLWLVGGSGLVRECLDAALIDDVIVSIHPILLGEGEPLAAPGAARMHLTLTAERRYPSGLVQLAYRADRQRD
jgi:dihydrofolate reductase